MRKEAETGKYRDTEKGMERVVDRETNMQRSSLKEYTQTASGRKRESKPGVVAYAYHPRF